jgi:hypothetical protein
MQQTRAEGAETIARSTDSTDIDLKENSDGSWSVYVGEKEKARFTSDPDEGTDGLDLAYRFIRNVLKPFQATKKTSRAELLKACKAFSACAGDGNGEWTAVEKEGLEYIRDAIANMREEKSFTRSSIERKFNDLLESCEAFSACAGAAKGRWTAAEKEGLQSIRNAIARVEQEESIRSTIGRRLSTPRLSRSSGRSR